MLNIGGDKLKKEQSIKRRQQIKIKNRKRKNNFDIDILKREIFRLQNGKDIENIFREKLEDKEVFTHEK